MKFCSPILHFFSENLENHPDSPISNCGNDCFSIAIGCTLFMPIRYSVLFYFNSNHSIIQISKRWYGCVHVVRFHFSWLSSNMLLRAFDSWYGMHVKRMENRNGNSEVFVVRKVFSPYAAGALMYEIETFTFLNVFPSVKRNFKLKFSLWNKITISTS